MTGSFKIIKTNKDFKVQGLEFDNYQYTTNFVKYYQQYLFEDTITFNILQKVNVTIDSQTEEVLEDSHFVEHTYPDEHNTKHCHDIGTFKFNKDGLHKVIHLIIPTQDWFAKYVSTFGGETLFQYYSGVYYTDGESIYKFTSSGRQEVEIEELIEINTEGTTLCRSEQFTFCIDRLEYCYYKLASALLDDICPIDECDDGSDNDAWYTLHLIQIELYVIKFLLELGRFIEAEQILSALSGCAGPCYSIINNNTSYLLTTKTKSNCGCSM